MGLELGQRFLDLAGNRIVAALHVGAICRDRCLVVGDHLLCKGGVEISCPTASRANRACVSSRPMARPAPRRASIRRFCSRAATRRNGLAVTSRRACVRHRFESAAPPSGQAEFRRRSLESGSSDAPETHSEKPSAAATPKNACMRCRPNTVSPLGSRSRAIACRQSRAAQARDLANVGEKRKKCELRSV